MLTSILPPVVHGNRPHAARRLWLALALWHSLASIVSAAAFGGLMAFTAHLLRRAGFDPRPWSCAIAILVVLIYLPRQLGLVSFPPLLQSTRQVPRHWAYDYPRWAAALLFGLGLGNGCYTRIVVPTYYFLIIWPFLAPGAFWPIVIWGGYGLARSLHVCWLAGTAPTEDLLPHVNHLAVALMRQARPMHLANAGLLAGTAVWLAFWGIQG